MASTATATTTAMRSIFICALLLILSAPKGCASFVLSTSRPTTSTAKNVVNTRRKTPLLSRRLCETHLYQGSSDDDSDDATESPTFTDAELQDMKDLILSLSLEKTDHDRRTRVKEVFVEALAKPNGMPDRFSALFDRVLTEVGDEIQMEAKKKFFEQQQQEQQENEDDSDDSDDSTTTAAEASDDAASEDGEERVKSPEELQLWALVDMMVQSKTIVKKRNGMLGSKGTFQ